MTDNPSPPAEHFPYRQEELPVIRDLPPEPQTVYTIRNQFADIAPKENSWGPARLRETDKMTPEQQAVHDLLARYYDQERKLNRAQEQLSNARQAWKSWVRRERESSKYHQSLQNANPEWFDQMAVSFPQHVFGNLDSILSEHSSY